MEPLANNPEALALAEKWALFCVMNDAVRLERFEAALQLLTDGLWQEPTYDPHGWDYLLHPGYGEIF